VRTGLSAPITYGGVEEPLLVANIGVLAILAFGVGQYWFIAVSILFHFVLRGVSKRDPVAGKIYLRFARQADIYVPWPVLGQKRGFRPEGFGRRERLM